MKYNLKTIVNKIRNHILIRADVFIDKRICGESLADSVPSIFRDDKNGIGGTSSQSTHYITLKRIFSHIHLSSSDTILDVGCGKGRVLAFLILKKYPCQIFGIEHNDEVSRIATGWAKRYNHVHVLSGDALQLDYNPFTVLTLARSFLPKTFIAFVEQFEKTMTHPATLIYWYDQESGYLLQDRPGWEMQTRGEITRVYGVKVYEWPQFYSIWKYCPVKKNKQS